VKVDAITCKVANSELPQFKLACHISQHFLREAGQIKKTLPTFRGSPNIVDPAPVCCYSLGAERGWHWAAMGWMLLGATATCDEPAEAIYPPPLTS